MGLLDILQQYAGGASPPASGNVNDHFDEVARQVPQQDLGNGVAAAFRSDATPPFAQMVGSLFGQSDPQQRAGALNQLIQSIGPGALSGVAGGALGRILGGGQPTTMTPQQASQVSPSDVTSIAAHAEQQDPSIVDRLGSFYAQHPTLVKTLGAVALSAVMGQLSSRR
jgi:hypothetical protein